MSAAASMASPSRLTRNFLGRPHRPRPVGIVLEQPMEAVARKHPRSKQHDEVAGDDEREDKRARKEHKERKEKKEMKVMSELNGHLSIGCG